MLHPSCLSLPSYCPITQTPSRELPNSHSYLSPNATYSGCEEPSSVPMCPFFSRWHSSGDTACGCPRTRKTTTVSQSFVPKGRVPSITTRDQLRRRGGRRWSSNREGKARILGPFLGGTRLTTAVCFPRHLSKWTCRVVFSRGWETSFI